jgi:hypothetical protein
MAARSLVSNPVSVIPDDEHEFEPRIEPVPKTRPIIDQAKGVLAAVRCKTPEAAFVEPKCVCKTNHLKVNALAVAPVVVCEPTSARCKACRGGPGRIWRYFVEALVHDPHLAHIALFKRRTRPVGLKRFDRSPFPHSSLAISQSVSLRHACSKRWALGRSRRPRARHPRLGRRVQAQQDPLRC